MYVVYNEDTIKILSYPSVMTLRKMFWSVTFVREVSGITLTPQ